MQPSLVIGGVVSAAALLPGATAAQGSWTDRLDWRGIVDIELAIETNDRDLQKWDFVVEPEITADLAPLGDLTVIGRLRLDPADALEPGQRDTFDNVRSPASRRLFVGDAADLELREFFLDRYIDDIFLRLGKQQIVWGEADGLRVLDIVNPFDFREFILPEFEDYRIPLWTVQAEVPIGPTIAQFVWIPDRTYDDVPEADGTFAFTSPRVVPRPPDILVGGGPVIVEAPDRPDNFITDDDYGVRLTAFVGGWDLSANYLYHFQDQSIPFRQALPGGGVRFTPRYERTHTIGGTFTNAFGDFTIRGEAAYSTDRFFIDNDAANVDGVFETGEFGYVLGLDYQYDADLLISGQVFQSIIEDPPLGATRDQVDTNLTLLVEQEFLNDTVTASGLLIQSVNDGDGLFQAAVEYQWRSNVILRAGADIFYGNEDGLNGQFDAADRITLGVEIGF